MFEASYHDQALGDKSFLVTGGAGFVGSNIVEYLVKYGAGKVRVLDSLITGHIENIQPFIDQGRVEFIQGDITDYGVCLKACKEVDYVCHQAALGSVPRSIANPAHTNSINVNGTLNIFNAAREQGVKRVVYASSSSVYGDDPTLPKMEGKIGRPLSPYAVSKYTNELYANAFANCYGMEMIGLRYFNIFGPKQDPKGPYAAVIPLFIDKIIQSETVQIDGDGEQTRDFTFVENAVQANVRAMLSAGPEAVGRVFNIAVGENFSVNYLYDQIRERLESTAQPAHREARMGDIRNSLADISAAREMLGYAPAFRFEDGLHITVDYFAGKRLEERN